VALALPPTVQAGDPVLLADGLMQLEVVDPGRARVIVGGDVPAGKGINLPASRLDLPSLTDKDRADLAFGLARGVDLVALSFVRRAADLDEVRAAGVPVVAKFEKAAAVERMEEIVAAADAVMVARGDLGVEIPLERVPVVQKALIACANRHGRPVITATQMLRSMVDSALPTRAEVTDVANAVLDGTDAVMLSEESAVGRYPVEAVAMMERILLEAETVPRPPPPPPGDDLAARLAHTACGLAAALGARAIVVPTRSGATARAVARYRPPVPVVALTPGEAVRRQLSLAWGVTAVTVPWDGEGESAVLAERLRGPVRETGLVAAGARVVIVAAWPAGGAREANLVHVATL
jgi:pyruvate kinase